MIALVYVGILLSLIGGIWLLVVAFQTSIWWGLGSLFIAPVSLVFTILHWQVAKALPDQPRRHGAGHHRGVEFAAIWARRCSRSRSDPKAFRVGGRVRARSGRGRMKIDTVLLVMASAFIASLSSRGNPRQKNFCEALKTFAAAERENGGGQVELKRQGRWLVDHVKSCVQGRRSGGEGLLHLPGRAGPLDGVPGGHDRPGHGVPPGQDQRLPRQYRISEWDGKIRFYSPNLDVEDIEIEMQ